MKRDRRIIDIIKRIQDYNRDISNLQVLRNLLIDQLEKEYKRLTNAEVQEKDN